MPNVYDAFLMFNEIELVELRIRELEEVVDYFVVVEAGHAHNNKPKPYHFNKEMASGKYDDILDKIKYVTVPEFPEGGNNMGREVFQRKSDGASSG